MSPASQKYKKEYAKELIKIAYGDYGSARSLSINNEGRIENAVYLCEQAIEKSLKAVLCHLNQPIVHTHDLDVLVTLLPLTHKPPEAHRLGVLSQYATIRRYEEGSEEIGSDDIRLTLELGKKVLEWAQNIIEN